MNILIANISVLREKKELDYAIELNDCIVSSVSAFHTNESILKAIINLKNIKETGGLGKIIALVSQKVLSEKESKFADLTAFEYYKNQVSKYTPDTTIECINLENDSGAERNIATVLQEICELINRNDIVYIDSAGGKRTTANLIQLLAKMLNYKGIKSPYTLYADINGKRNVITDAADFVRMTELADAFNEFMTSGRTQQLTSCFANTSTESVKQLLSAMTEFSDKIQLGNVDKLDSAVKTLRIKISEVNDSVAETNIETVILKQFLPIIQEKLIGQENNIDYVKIIRWCLDNMLIQQALTLFVEKLPIYLFEHDIIRYVGDESRKRSEYTASRNKMQPADWETYVFYTDILNIQDPLLSELKLYLLKNVNPKSEPCKEVVSVLSKINKTWGNLKIPPKFAYLEDEIAKGKFSNFHKFKNMLATNKTLLCKMLGIDNNEKSNGDNTIQNKIESIKKIEDGYKVPCYVFHVDDKTIAKIFYNYIYVKSLRNLANHASSEETLTVEQKSVLIEHGIDCSKMDEVNIIKKNILSALDLISVEEKAYNNRINQSEIAQPIVPTTLKVGEIVTAICTDKKIVRINGYDYNIQLVIPKASSPEDFLHRIIEVRIKQISKAGKINQVEFVKINI